MNKSKAMFDAWLMQGKPVVAVIVIDHKDNAIPLANALKAGGVRMVEITLRTPAALDSINALADQFPDIIVGAGTVVTPEQVDQVAKAGGRFIVSPGFSAKIAERAEQYGVAYLPGVATATEIMTALESGYEFLKFYPAAQIGGVNMLKALSGPFPQVIFCPTGGISEQDYSDYLDLDNVRCIGGSWFAANHLIREKNWDAVTTLAARLS
ncbi:bifunctional 4-hydroxy-2-oxoglutarate aldolase/2-dehydro-3-deoxy-phosphogluconate aldolase [Alkalimarinus alittae]|uniref:2-dehydro-3-deoxy-phosphogluconate aldolase n=1 Tax=Alkalimarinus alittae TaxID=2961619 RepID=A0ABY6MXM2_9ALTE|nr:bifunctional 4-hydroxy-2-oxoglutarate aldolase/2-dehydro-3-deoxy-phosphogluconate aldolase [Alkalimarinus alittae]UZE94555.1 bifunctional 4-hydroxy-2-oxoglutarate aldolase/2-dehydro-3-deoxy-phosphogluconate aldolase [Alkalimarinus alittae]